MKPERWYNDGMGRRFLITISPPDRSTLTPVRVADVGGWRFEYFTDPSGRTLVHAVHPSPSVRNKWLFICSDDNPEDVLYAKFLKEQKNENKT